MATIKIEVTYNPEHETLSQAMSSLLNASAASAAAPVAMAAPCAESVQLTMDECMAAVPETTATAETHETTAATENTAAKPVAKADVRALAVALSKSNKAKLKEILQSFGATKLSAISDDQYPALYEKLVAANA